MALVTPANAVPAFARRYGVTCSTCHSTWPALNATGIAFKLSGYRRLNGQDLKPTTADIELAAGALSIPSIPPLALTASTGWDYQRIQRRALDGTRTSQTGNSIDLDEVSIFVATPLGEHLSTFMEFPMFETHAPGMDFTGPWAANQPIADVAAGTIPFESKKDITFESESPTFEMGKVMWNSLLPASWAQPDSLNIKLGVDQLPTGFSPEANRISVRSYLIYRRRAIDLISTTVHPEDITNADQLNRLGEPQMQVALNGLIVPFGKLTDLGTGNPVWLDYEVGVTNGTNNNPDTNTEKDFFGHVAVNFFGQRLGFFGYASPDIYDDSMRTDPTALAAGLFSGQQVPNRMHSFGPDLRLSLEPFNIPVWLDTQVLFNRESDPTGFHKAFEWWGGFAQLNGRIPIGAKYLQWITAYARYDWIDGDRFDDTANGGTTGPVRPRESQGVLGLQWFVLENMKVITEVSRNEFRNTLSTPAHERVIDDFATIRVAFGF